MATSTSTTATAERSRRISLTATRAPRVQRPFNRPHVNLYPKPKDSGYVHSLPEVIDFNAKNNADQLFCIQARKGASGGSTTTLPVSHSQLRDAVSRCAQWLKENVKELQLPTVGEDGKVKKGPPVALLMESDVGLIIYEFALMSMGVPIMLLSARLSAAAIHHLLNETSAQSIIVSPRLRANAEEGLSMFDAGSQTRGLYSPVSYVQFLGPSTSSASICHPNHYVGEEDRDVLVLHSSGTTGLPKPIYVSHRHMVCFLTCHDFKSEEEAQGTNVSTLPLYHGFGIMAPALSMGVGKTFCLPPTSIVSNASSTTDLIVKTNARSLMSVPSILDDISMIPNDEGSKILATLDFVAFGGGVLKPSIGDKLKSKGVNILNHYGTTETGPLSPMFVPDADYDWKFFRLRKDTKLDLQELPSVNGERRFKLAAFPFGWGKRFEIQDQLVCNPNHPDTDFNAVGRNDDIIPLATGEKVNPRILENMLTDSDSIKAAIAFGETQFEIGVIVQPTKALKPEQQEQFKEDVWQIVLKANELMDDHAKISSQEAVIVVPDGMAIPRTDKGSIARREVYKLFEAAIAEVYNTLENTVTDASIQPIEPANFETGIKKLIQERCSWRLSADAWTAEDDLFELGMDSLQAARLRRYLLAAIPKAGEIPHSERISRGFVYLYPSVTRMAAALRDESTSVKTLADISSEVDQLVKDYGVVDSVSTKSPIQGAVILLTGGTGSLGSHCLARFTNLPNVARVICLNRSKGDSNSKLDSEERQKSSFEAKGINLTKEEWSKLTVYQTNTASPRLGLTEAEYTDLQGSVTHIFHNAWPMDFKRQLSSFKGSFQTLQNLLALAREAHKIHPLIKPRLLFISSIATIGQWADVNGGRIVPEVPVENIEAINGIGYAQAKLVCERILEQAVSRYGSELEATYVRFGQLSGSTKSGFWNTDEHFCALVKSSQRIGALPRVDGTFSWIPVDHAADVLSELLLSTEAPAMVYQVENPIRQSWSDALGAIGSELRIERQLSFDEWLAAVGSAVDGSVEANPAKKLLEFFKLDFTRMASGKVIMGTDVTRAASKTLREMDAVPGEIVAKYVRYWRAAGFLKA